jgi:hypothetical protein
MKIYLSLLNNKQIQATILRVDQGKSLKYGNNKQVCCFQAQTWAMGKSDSTTYRLKPRTTPFV